MFDSVAIHVIAEIALTLGIGISYTKIKTLYKVAKTLVYTIEAEGDHNSKLTAQVVAKDNKVDQELDEIVKEMGFKKNLERNKYGHK